MATAQHLFVIERDPLLVPGSLARYALLPTFVVPLVIVSHLALLAPRRAPTRRSAVGC